MPSARQLLEQADALMRRNRKRGKGKGNGPPTLTDALTNERTGTLAPTIILPESVSADPIVPGSPPTADPIALDTLSDLPVLTDVVDTWPAQAEVWPPLVPDPAASALAEALDDALAAPSESPPPNDPAADAAVVIPSEDDAATSSPGVEAPATNASEAAPDAESTQDDAAFAQLAVEPAAVEAATVSPVQMAVDVTPPSRIGELATQRTIAAGEPTIPAAMAIDRPSDVPREALPHPIQDEEFILDIPPAAEPPPTKGRDVSTPAEPAVAAIPEFVPGSPAWEAMAEEIRMQVLQRLDLFTDTGMRDQLGARLQPIVARASAELVETINHALGELVRGYVAEAIEREIESWRKRDG